MSQQSDQLIIVLHLLDAINFHRPKNTPIVLSASLDKNVLETGSRLPGIASTSFDSNLVWETDRGSVKRMKMENLPIRIECYSVSQTNSEQVRTLVGCVLLPLRSVPLLPSTKSQTLKARWHRVIGLHSQEWKSLKPEIQLMVMITDKHYLLAGKQDDRKQENRNEADQSVVIFTNPAPSQLGMGADLPIRLLEDRGLLQVGCYEQECDIFLVKIVLKYAKRMQMLVPVENQSVASAGKFAIRYDLLGDTYPCMLEKRSNELYLIQEKIVINLRTSLHSLRRYFEKVFLIRLEVLYEDKIVGRVRLRFGELIVEERLNDFLSKHSVKSNTMDVEKYYQIEPTSDKYEENDIPDAISDGSSLITPAVKCKFSLKYLSTDRGHIPDSISKATKPVPETEPSEDKPALELEIPQIASINLNETRSIHPPSSIQLERNDIETILYCESRDLRDVPRTFSYNLLLQSVRFNVRPSTGMWQLSLHHPRADTPLTKVTLELTTIESETLEFSNLQLRLYFSSLTDLVLETITAESSKLTLHGPHDLYGFARLDNQSLVVGTKEKQAGVAILENQNGESIGMATIFCFLDEVGINYNSRDPVAEAPVSATPRAQLDDQISYRMLEEQKQWMIKQREAFIEELKQKKSAHLMKLSNEWKKRRAKESAEINEKMEHVSALTRALEETRKSLTFQSTQLVDQNKAVEEMKTKLEISYQRTLSDIREKATRLEEDLNHRSKLQTLRCEELERKNDSLTRDNDQLKRVNERLEGELAIARREAEHCIDLRKQIDTLEQRLRETEQSKLFYKQQWAKMVRELNKMKQENEEQLSDALRGKDRRKQIFHWDDEPSPCCIQTSDEDLKKIHRLIFEEQCRQQHQSYSADHCC
ncbi:centrosomal protein of 120 kDa-like [Toxorhynchites rutilus septentrionalis]|uniref:centrosomal protein of 120 kDa-like n=1 Tax=Toxorhynchites rutilus septentrionalis TaxID=329112 RepID=UPI00247A35E4|nr:centrosomal protein of 120 kDa-like [Toxorhynchites rutilus septentrionalis]